MTIRVTNNPDGTFTVNCGTETVIVGTPAQAPTQGAGLPGLPPLGPPGGFGTAQILDTPHPPAGSRPAENAEKLMAMLRSERASLPRGNKASMPPRVVDFTLHGPHTLDVGKLSELAAGEDPKLAVRIHMVRERA
jgi:hypothetical protein